MFIENKKGSGIPLTNIYTSRKILQSTIVNGNCRAEARFAVKFNSFFFSQTYFEWNLLVYCEFVRWNFRPLLFHLSSPNRECRRVAYAARDLTQVSLTVSTRFIVLNFNNNNNNDNNFKKIKLLWNTRIRKFYLWYQLRLNHKLMATRSFSRLVFRLKRFNSNLNRMSPSPIRCSRCNLYMF